MITKFHCLSVYLYSDFCKKELTEQSFTRKVARLNTNILYLCYTQRVKLHKLSPSHTLENINKLLNDEFSELGRIGPVEVSDGFQGATDYKLMQDLSHGGDSESEEGMKSNKTNAFANCCQHHIKLSFFFSFFFFSIRRKFNRQRMGGCLTSASTT